MYNKFGLCHNDKILTQKQSFMTCQIQNQARTTYIISFTKNRK